MCCSGCDPTNNYNSVVVPLWQEVNLTQVTVHHGASHCLAFDVCVMLQDTYDEELLGAVAELLPIMATALGPQTYGPVFQQLVFQPLLKRFQAGQPDGVRSTMIGHSPAFAAFCITYD